MLMILAIAALNWGGDGVYGFQLASSVARYTGDFQNGSALAVLPSGVMYVLDRGTAEIVKLSSTGEVVAHGGGMGLSESSLEVPYDLYAENALRLYVPDYSANQIEYYDGNLNVISELKLHDSNDPTQVFGYPHSVATDRFGSMYIVDGENIRVDKIAASLPNVIDRYFGDVAAGAGRLKAPGRIRVSADDKVYIRDSSNIVVFDVYGNYLYTTPLSRFKTFSLFGNDVVTLDEEKVRDISKPDLPPMLLPADCRPVDFAIVRDSLYLLESRRIAVVPLDSAWVAPASR
jgi:hypothetical protein